MNKKFGALSSTNDPEQLSLTVKAIVVALLPVVKNLLGIEIGSEQVNAVVDAVFTLIFAGVAIYGYIRSKRD